LVPRCVARLVHFTLPGSDEPIWRDDPHVAYEFGDLRSLSFAAERFDRIVCVSTLEHVGMDTTRFGAARAAGDPESAAGAVAELLRVLKPRGELLITVPYGCAADRGWYRILDRPALDALMAPAIAHDVGLRFFYYDRGWFEGGPQLPAIVAQGGHDPDIITGVAIASVVKRS
jgi:SAM-dependent methyltransferase